MLETIRMIVGVIILIFYFTMVPTVIGITGSKVLCTKRKVSTAEAYIWGNIILWVIFQMLCVPMGIIGISFTTLTIIFAGIVLLLLILAFRLQGKGIFREVFSVLEKIRHFKWIEWTVMVLILVQACVSAFAATYIGMDDAAYMAISLDAVGKDSIASIDFYTGLPAGVPLKILLTSWNYYISFLGKISGVHVAAVARSFLPVVLIPMAYLVYLLLARVFFQHDRKKISFFLLCINLLIMFGGYSWYTVTLRLDICVWHGKAVMAAIMLPFLFYYLLQTNEYQKRDLLCLLLIMIATCAMSLMGVGLSILIVVGAIVSRYQKKNIKKGLPLLLVVTIVALVAVFYFLKMSSVNNFSYERVKELFPKAVAIAFGADSLYWNGTWIRWFYYICLVYLLVRRKRNRNSRFLTRYIIWQYIVMFNPVFYYIAYLFLEGSNVYVRLYYTLFPEICMAYILTLLIFDFKQRRNSVICAGACVALIMVLGKPYQEIANFSKPQNIYKLPQEVIEICDMINTDSPQVEPRVVASEGMNVYLRQYSSRIGMLYGRGPYDYNNQSILHLIQNNQITMEEIVELMKENNCQYLVWEDNLEDVEEVENLGGHMVGRTENYVVIKINAGVAK